MAATSLLALIDDITTVLDDVAILTKVATKKTAGVLGDDLALNAEQVTGVRAARELPVVWAVFKGSLVNKAILVPAALLISAVASWAVTPLLMMGGLFLCFEGFEKVAHKLLHSDAEDAEHQKELKKALVADELAKLEKAKVKGAIRTDFILSAEIVVIALGIVSESPFLTQVGTLSAIALMMTIGVYGLVAGIVKLDDLGLYLSGREGPGTVKAALRRIGSAILVAAPWLMRLLSIAGTAAMFLVGGGILAHGIPPLHHWVDSLGARGGLSGGLAGIGANALVGVVAGGLAVAIVSGVKRLRGASGTPEAPPPGGDASAH